MESEGYEVHYPTRNTKQIDPSGGFNICTENCQAIRDADEIHVFWTKKSQGSTFDLGMTFRKIQDCNKPIKIANREEVEAIVEKENKEKSFEHVLLKLARK